MEVILLDKVGKLGTVGDKVNVKSGFGRNYLIPQGKAVPANAENLVAFESRRAELEAAANDKKTAAEGRAKLLAELKVIMPANAGEGGKLFGSIGARDIAEAITAAGVKVSKSEVKLPGGTLRDLGEYQVDVQLHFDVTQQVNVIVEAE